MPEIRPSDAPVHDLEADALIVGYDGDQIAAHPLLTDDVRAALTDAAAGLEPGVKPSAVVTTSGHGLGVAARRVVVVGLGKGTPRCLRYAAGTASRAVGKSAATVVVALPLETDAHATAVAEGLALGSYTYTDYKGAATSTEPVETSWQIAGASEQAVAAAMPVVESVLGARDLTNTPPRDLPPAVFAEIAETLAAPLGVTVEVWDEERLAAEGFGGIVGVGMGSSRPPRLVRVEWAPEGAEQSVAFVGKGITFDSGGLSLKPPKGMETMKSDMTGAGVALHTVLGAAKAQLRVKAVAWLCLAENLPSGTAQRPSDVVTTYNGITVEVLNTDAEGRMVLADGLARAIEEEPDAVIDIATLTGAQGIALGSRTSGVMGTEELRDEVVAASEAAAESMWPMPLPSYLRETYESKIADLKNIGDGTAGMIGAGVFLKEFVGETPWAHLDIARPAYNEGSPWGFTPAGGTGAAVRTLLQFLATRTQA